MDNTNYYDYMTVKDLRDIIGELPDDMKIVIPVVDEEALSSRPSRLRRSVRFNND